LHAFLIMSAKVQTSADALLDRLTSITPTDMPVLSVYLDARSNAVGRDGFEPFLRKELHARIESYPQRSPERESVEADAERIQKHVRDRVPPSANTVAIFACAATGLFEAESLDAAYGENRVFVGEIPHLYPLARLAAEYRRYAALVADTHVARIFVFGLGQELEQQAIVNERTRRAVVGGWSQMRYQRHVDHRHLKHAKEAAAALTRVVRSEGIEHVVIGGDEVILPLVRAELPKDVTQKVIDVVSLEVRAPEHEVLGRTLDAFRRHDAATDVEAVGRLFDEYRGGGLAVVGLLDTISALEAGRVDELLLTAAPVGLDRSVDREHDSPTAGLTPDQLMRRETLAGDLVIQARRTGAALRFIEDAGLLWAVGGAGAFLRYSLPPEGPAESPLFPDVDYEP
jgi:peptide chain release factor subunit 1